MVIYLKEKGRQEGKITDKSKKQGRLKKERNGKEERFMKWYINSIFFTGTSNFELGARLQIFK